jgi:hypothetical protein
MRQNQDTLPSGPGGYLQELLLKMPLSHSKPYTVAQLDTELYFNLSLVLGTDFGRNGRYAILQLVGDRPQQVAATI